MNFETFNKSFKRLLATYLSIFLIFFFIFLMVFSQILINYNYETKLNTFKIEEDMELKQFGNQIISKIQDHKDEIILLSLHNELIYYIETSNEKYLDDFKTEMLQISLVKKHYDKIRFINSTGFEVVRVNYNNSNPYIVLDNELQYKGDRYYFNDTFKLNNNEIFVSPLDLSTENELIEIPFKPIIRIATPVFISNGTKVGIIIFNYKGNDFLDLINNDYDIHSGIIHFLVSTNGNILKSYNKSEEWGFMLPHINNFNIKYEMDLIKIFNNKIGKINRNDGLFIFHSFNPLESEPFSFNNDANGQDPNYEKSYDWILISFMSRSELQSIHSEITESVLDILISLILVYILFSFIFSYLLALIRNSELKVKELEIQHKEKLLHTNNLLLKQRNELSDYAHIMNHDLNNHTKILSQYISLYKLDHNEDHLVSVENQIGKIESFLGHSLKLADLGLVIDNKHQVNIVNFLKEFSKSYNHINFNYRNDFPMILGDEQKIHQIFLNIIENATVHGNADNIEIKISRSEKHGYYDILIINNGLSINEDNKEKIFDKGFTTKVNFKGEFGLGMYIVSKICKSHGWSIILKDNKNVTFAIQIPKSDIVN